MVKYFFVFFLFFISFCEYSFANTSLADCSIGNESKEITQYQTFKDISTTAVMQYAWPCAKEAFQGAWDNTTSHLTKGLECLSPIKCARQATEAVSKAFDFFANITDRVRDAFYVLSEMPMNHLAAVICGSIGGLGADILLGVMTGGLGAGKLALTISSIVSKLSKLGSLFKKGTKIPIEILASLKEKSLDKIERLRELGYEKLLTTSMETCQ